MAILDQEPLLKTAVINPASFHITLAVLSISNEEDLLKYLKEPSSI